MIDLHDTVVVSGEQISTDMASETVILNMKNGMYYGLDDVGTFIWQRIQTPNRVDQVVDALVSEYDVAEERANGDIIRLLTELHNIGLVSVVS